MNPSERDKLTRRTSVYVRDLPGMIETLKFRIRYKLERLSKGHSLPESKEQLDWALGVCDLVRERFANKLPFPVGSLTYVMGTTWPVESDLRDEFIRLEKAYPSALGK